MGSWLESLPDGLDTELDSGGGGLSAPEFLRHCSGTAVLPKDQARRERMARRSGSGPGAGAVFFRDRPEGCGRAGKYPIGHLRRREEGIPLLVEKFESNLRSQFPDEQARAICQLFKDQKDLDNLPVSSLMARFV